MESDAKLKGMVDDGDRRGEEIRAAVKLTGAAVAGLTDLVEAMHLNISRAPWPVGKMETGRTRGLTGLVYSMIRGVARAVSGGLDAALVRLTPLLGPGSGAPSLERETLLAALNGVSGDYLASTGNALAIRPRIRQGGVALTLRKEALAAAIQAPARRVLVMVHGFCMSDLQWRREGHEHGATLASALGSSVVHFHYNSGLRISENGTALASLLEELVREWPTPLEELNLVGYSMGGLVARSACQQGALAGHAWSRIHKRLIFVGTPHHGAPLARGGGWAHLLLGISPYSAALTLLSERQSAGLVDLRAGFVLEGNAGAQLPLGVECFAIAGSKSACATERPASDGLVPVESAFGQHAVPALCLPFDDSRRFISYGTSHLDLLAKREVYERLLQWLA